MKHFDFRLAAINLCPVLVSSELLLSTHLPTSEGWIAELPVGLWLVVPRMGFEPTRVDSQDPEHCALTIWLQIDPVIYTIKFSRCLRSQKACEANLLESDSKTGFYNL